MSSEGLSIEKIIYYVLYGIPITMGVVSVIIALIQPDQAINMILPLGLGMACLGIAGLDLLEK
ncbi:MAG: hypothetical protein JSW11_11985 [Candidatus Heimdallarchaeota archaeon]|nr:MAG: hypothetical protein JSW11_11985 [Candidatus Heimdallarchaeota archaeon]